MSLTGRARGGRGRRTGVVAVLGLVVLAGCAERPKAPEVTATVDAARPGGRYKIGKPYQIKGIWYYPAVDYGYSEIGVASWYGPGFDGQETANGEIYDMNDLTAAHRTLPMPSVVRVTNLANGRSIKLRVNDRGPFAQGRILDVSRRAAQLLGFYQQGTTQVQVDIEAEESRQIAQALTGGAAPTMVAARAAPPPPPLVPIPVPASEPAPSAFVETPPALPAETIVAERAAVGFQPPTDALAGALSDGTVDLPLGEPLAGESVSVPPAFLVEPLTPPVPPLALAPIHSSMAETAPTRPRPGEPSAAGFRSGQGVGAGHARAFVQAGAFADPGNANQARARLTEIGPVVVSPLNVDGRPMYRVRIGPLPPGENAERIRLATARAGYPASRVVLE